MPETRRRQLDRLFMDFFGVILCLASDYGKNAIPNISDVLYCDFVNALLEYATGKEKPLGLRHDFFRKRWEIKSNKLLEENAEKISEKLTPEIGNALMIGLKQHWRSSHGESWYLSFLDTWIRCWDRPSTSTFSLTVPFVEKRKKIMAGFDSALMRKCEEIAILLKKYMEEDAVYIRAHYHW